METLAREIKEETGLNSLQGVYPYTMFLSDIRITHEQNDVGLIFSVYRLDMTSPFYPTLSKEHVCFDWFTPFEAAQKLVQYPKEFIESIARLG